VTTLTQPTRRHLSPRQTELVDRLLEAAAEDATEHGYEGSSVRSAARRAGLAPATAYTYFASKDHLLAEVLWRRLERIPEPQHEAGVDVLELVTCELGRLGTFMAAEPELATACTTALLGSGADVRVVRDRFGARIVSRISAALGEHPDPSVLATLNLALIGAMLSAGMGHISYDEVPRAMSEAAALVIGRSN
jgi:AcrR family transcriptional regulator